MHNEDRITYFAETDSRNRRAKFGIKAKDRTRHVYVIGKTGMGKSTLLENMAVQDIRNNEGMAFIDPHGKTAELLMNYIPEHRKKDVLYFAPFDMEHPISFNIMEDVGEDKRHLVANGLMSTFKKIWVDAWSARMEYILNNTLLALLEYPDSTLIGVNRMLADKDYRKKVVANISDPSVKSFWVDEFEKYGQRYMQEAGASIQNKIGQFISNPLVRNIIGQPHSTFDMRKIMDEGKIVIINLSKGKVGEQNANLIGSMLITKVYLSAMSRADVNDAELQKLPNFYLYVDEFQSFANESFADILSEARKYKLNLTIAHQYIEQMSEEVRAAVFGNVGTMITFRVGAFDAEILEKEFSPQFTAEDLVNLGFAQIYLKLMIDGIGSSPFSAVTLPPMADGVPEDETTEMDEVIRISRESFAKPRAQVEAEIREWHNEQDGNGGNNKGGNNRDNNNRNNRNSNNSKGNRSNNSNNNSRNSNNSNTKNNNRDNNQKNPFKEILKEVQDKENKKDKSDEKESIKNDNKENHDSSNNSTQNNNTKKDDTKQSRQIKQKDDFDNTDKKTDNQTKDRENNSLSNKPKKPTKENVNELKNVLGDILKSTKKEEKKDSDTNNANKNDGNDNPKTEGSKKNNQETNQSQENIDTKESKKSSNEKEHVEQKKSTSQKETGNKENDKGKTRQQSDFNQNSKNDHSYENKKQKSKEDEFDKSREVTSEELRRILKVENEN